jgi:hypothetical protein
MSHSALPDVPPRRLSSRTPQARGLSPLTASFWLLAAALGFWFHAGEARADPLCPGGPTVELAIELEPDDGALRERLERQVRAELAARSIHVCRGELERVVAGTGGVSRADAVRGDPWLAQLRLRAQPPELELTRMRVQTRAGATVDRELDLSPLPRAARPSAIATAADELLAAALAAPPTPGAPSVTNASPQSGGDGAPAPPPSEPYGASDVVALGVGAAVSGFRGFTSTYGASLALRLRPLPRLAVTLGVGYASGWQALTGAARGEELAADDSVYSARAVPVGLPEGVRSSIGYAQVDLGLELMAVGPWELSAHAGARGARSTLRLEYAPEVTEGRIGFGAGSRSAGFYSDPRDPLPPRGRLRDHATDLLGSAGLEGRWRRGAWSFSTSLLALVPLLSSFPDDLELFDGLTHAREGHGARLGAELRLGAWFAFGGP